MAEPWRSVGPSGWPALCASGKLITRGPLNDTYRVDLAGAAYLVRHRTVHDDAYGQTFAGERHVPVGLRRLLRVPALLDVVSDAYGREAFAIFEFIEASPTRPGVDPLELPEILATIHATRGPGLGDLGRPLEQTATTDFVSGLIEDELRRLGVGSEERAVREAGQGVLRATGCFGREAPCLCHGDVHAANFLRARDGRISVIDWEAARFRVAAADFNQLHDRWLSPSADQAVLRGYAERTGRDLASFARQVAALRFLWHVRTFNFHVLVRGDPPTRHLRQLNAAVGQAGLIARG
jgi:aminoglycoside phosphotransferase (APT) family kinase protein